MDEKSLAREGLGIPSGFPMKNKKLMKAGKIMGKGEREMGGATLTIFWDFWSIMQPPNSQPTITTQFSELT